jgi:hypothetical protein
MTERAVAHLAARLEIAPNAVEVVSTHREEMPLQGLGCPATDVENPGTPQKGTPVLPAFIMGQVIRLQAGDTTYEYHAGGGQLIFCGTSDGPQSPDGSIVTQTPLPAGRQANSLHHEL